MSHPFDRPLTEAERDLMAALGIRVLADQFSVSHEDARQVLERLCAEGKCPSAATLMMQPCTWRRMIGFCSKPSVIGWLSMPHTQVTTRCEMRGDPSENPYESSDSERSTRPEDAPKL